MVAWISKFTQILSVADLCSFFTTTLPAQCFHGPDTVELRKHPLNRHCRVHGACHDLYDIVATLRHGAHDAHLVRDVGRFQACNVAYSQISLSPLEFLTWRESVLRRIFRSVAPTTLPSRLAPERAIKAFLGRHCFNVTLPRRCRSQWLFGVGSSVGSLVSSWSTLVCACVLHPFGSGGEWPWRTTLVCATV